MTMTILMIINYDNYCHIIYHFMFYNLVYDSGSYAKHWLLFSDICPLVLNFTPHLIPIDSVSCIVAHSPFQPTSIHAWNDCIPLAGLSADIQGFG